MEPLDRVRIVLVRPEEAGNVGAAARVLKNFGLSDLVLVAPRLTRPEEAVKWARGAEDVLEGAQIVDDLETAIASCAVAWAVTRRGGRLRRRFASLREAATRTAALAVAQPVAWVFGPESRGLSTAETERCSARVTIPTSPRQPSLNLAQAVALCSYEIALDARETPAPAARRLATTGEREALYHHLEAALLQVGFLHPQTRRARMATLQAILERADLSPHDVRFLRGIARQVEWAGTVANPPGEEPPDTG